MRSISKILMMISCLMILISCSDETPTDPAARDRTTDSSPVASLKSVTQTVINNFIVQYDGRTFDGDETTFSYTVYGTGVEPALSHFTLELPDCAPELSGYSPTNSVSINYNPQIEIFGIEWHLHVEADDSVGRQYSITFVGDVPEGVIHSAVKTGDTTGVGQVYGPCAGFEISGTVYVDANTDGLRDLDESGIANVVVELVHADASVDTLRTDALGDFSIIRADGAYTLRIDFAAYPNSFNADLLESFDATTPTELAVTIGPDAPGNDFGFSPQTEEIILELESGILLSDGKSVKFWTRELRAALHNGGGNVVYDRATLEGFIADIQELYLAEVYQFTPGNELQEAFDILKSRSREATDILLRELLATEFNEVSGRGLIGDDAELQDVLIAWGEAIVVENQAAAGASGNGGGHEEVIPTEDPFLRDVIQIFEMINTGGGGGVDE